MAKTVTKPATAVASGVPVEGGPWVIGKSYLIRTVTYFVLGRLAAVYDRELVLEEASWIADTGRFNECLRSGKLLEVEPFTGQAIVGRMAITDATEWTHKLPLQVV